MSICIARLRDTSNALTLRMSGEQIRLQIPPKLFGVNSWIVQVIRPWIPDCWSFDRKCTGVHPTTLKRGTLSKAIIWQYFAITRKRCEIGYKFSHSLIEVAYELWRLVPTSVTLNNLERSNGRFCVFRRKRFVIATRAISTVSQRLAQSLQASFIHSQNDTKIMRIGYDWPELQSYIQCGPL